MCQSECCAVNGEPAEPSPAFQEMDGWDTFADGVSLFDSYQKPSATD